MLNQISSWAIRHPIPTIVLFIALTAAGFAGFGGMRINTFPDVDIPVVSVSVSQPGAAPAELEIQVARKIEDAVVGLGDVEHVRTVVGDGSSTTTIEFALGKNTDRAVNDVRDAVTKIRPQLPGGIQEPVISRLDNSGGAILTYSVASERMDELQLSWFIDNDVAKEVLTVAGVSQIRRNGGQDREIRIDLDADRLMAFGVTATEVNRQIRALNINLPGGRGTLGTSEQSIRTLGSALSIDQLRETRITLAGGSTVRLGDLGAVTDAAGEVRQVARLNGKPVVSFGVIRSVGSSEEHVARGVEEAVKALSARHPDVKFELVGSTVEQLRKSYLASMEALYLGGLLAVVVVFWFLRDWRATALAAVAMPLSILPTFAVMQMLGFSLNNMSLLALALVVGILVDDAIVEIENIVRHMRSGKRPFQAALEAVEEIGLAVVATTFTIVAVFLPVSFMGGMPGQFFRSFGITVAVAVLFSLVVARLLTPVMGAYLLRKPAQHRPDPSWMKPYLRMLDWALARRRLTVLAGAGFFFLSLTLIFFIPSGFVPTTDQSQTALVIELPPGTKLKETDALAQQATQILLKHKEVRSVFSTIGSGAGGHMMSGGGGGDDVRRATLTINLVEKDERSISQRDFEGIMRKELLVLPGARLRIGSDFGPSSNTVAVTLGSDDGVALEQAALQLEREMRTIPGLANPSSSASLLRPELTIRPRLDKAAELGVTVEAIGSTARLATLGDIDANLAKFNLSDRQIPIRVRIADEARGDLATLENLRVPGAGGAMVPLKSVASIEMASGPAQVDRLDRQRYVTVTAEMNGNLQFGTAMAAVHKLPIMRNLPPRVFEMNYGMAERMKELSTGFGLAMFAGLLLMYLVLVLLFGGFVQPLTIMAALPLAIGGALGLLVIAREAMSMPAMIGILMLMGIASKNSILLVEYAIMAMRDHGLDQRSALFDAASKRARPVIMTTIAMGAGMVPIALRMGAEADFRAPMAIAVLGGLLTSTLLSLVYIPVAFSYMDDAQRWLSRRLGRLVNTSEESPLGGAIPPGPSAVVAPPVAPPRLLAGE